MTLDEFIKKWKGKHVDFDGVYPNQCMDLMHQYVYEVLEILDASVLAAPSARLVFENFRWNDLFEKIPNTPLGVPQPGDIIIWGEKVGEHGHIAVFVEGDVNTFKSFDANWPVGSLPHIQEHNYYGVLGWLRPITACSEWRKKAEYEEAEKNKYKKEAREGRDTIETQETTINTLSKSLSDLGAVHQKLIEEDKIEDEEHRKLIGDFAELSKEYKDQGDRYVKIDGQLQTIIEERDEWRSKYERIASEQFNWKELLNYILLWVFRSGEKGIKNNEISTP